MEHAHLNWQRGGLARIFSMKDDAVVLLSTISSPPGSRIDAVLASDGETRVRVKVHSSKKQDDGTFRIEGRLIDVTREVRARVVAALLE